MALEIERKFLVDSTHPALVALLSAHDGIKITQGYLSSDPARVVRVRLYGEQAFLTIKGPQVGLARPEFEYAIPYTDAVALLALCPTRISKTRYRLPWSGGLTFEVDLFAGFALAEVELPSPTTPVVLPPWVGLEVSEDPKYTNVELAKSLSDGSFPAP